MKIGRVFPELLTPISSAASIEAGLTSTVRRLVGLNRALAGALVFRPPRKRPIVVTAGARRLPAALDAWLREAVVTPARGRRVARATPPGATAGTSHVLLRTPLGAPGAPVGELALLAPRRGVARALPRGFARELGVAIEQVWRLHRRTVRLTVLNEITRLGASAASLNEVFQAFPAAVARLVCFDALSISLIDVERHEYELIDLALGEVPSAPSDSRRSLDDTLLAEVAERRAPARIDDVTRGFVPRATRERMRERGHRSLLLVPLLSRGAALGAVTLTARAAGAFDDLDTEIVAELASPLASAIEQRRLLDESRRRADELTALYTTSQLITARLDVASVLDRISRAVAALIGESGCGIGLLDADGKTLVQAAAYGFKGEAWGALSVPLGEGIIGRCADAGAPIRVDDVRLDPRSARRDVDEEEGIRAMLCVPLKVAGTMIGVISAFATRPAAFTAHDQRLLEAFAEQAGIAIHNAQLFEESVRRARETRALLEAGRTVTASLDVAETIRVILAQARTVLGVHSCGLMTREPDTGDFVSVASLDLPDAMVTRIRVREGEGITGLAVRDRRPVQSEDLYDDPRVLFPELPRASGLRSMLAAPLVVGDRAVGAITVFRRDVHRFSPAEEELLLALADQAAIALEHARLYTEQEHMVAARTQELNEQKRFVEVVLETLPLGVFVVDHDLAVVRANREGGRVLGLPADGPSSLAHGLPADARASVEAFLRSAFARGAVMTTSVELTVAGELKILELTAAPLGADDDTAPTHVVLLVEDITRAKRLERQILLTDRLTTAGRLAAGVAHELNNPLATIAGCAEALQARLRENETARLPMLGDFPAYLGLIEEEAFRCKEITGNLLQLVRDPGSQRARTDLNSLLQKAVELLGHQSRFARARFVAELDPDLPEVIVNEGQVRQVFVGLASNALEAMDGRGTLTLRSRVHRGEIQIDVEDEGPGIPEKTLPRIFDPFFTTKPPGQGTGLGLAIAQGIVADHGGRIEVASRPGRGTRFRVVLPA
ncbi:MAG TPA: GAF domain-containing protein [Methylomirabilota bacterium]|jgi:signal transduction histidine kinase/putative methionine-R-sulfoxide reductase with GAF domain